MAFVTQPYSVRIRNVVGIVVIGACVVLYFAKYNHHKTAQASVAPASLPALGERQPRIIPLPVFHPFHPLARISPSPTPTPHASPTPCEWCAQRAERYRVAVQSGFNHNQANIRELPSMVQR